MAVSSARRAAVTPASRRLLQAGLIAGIILCVALGLGPVWAVRVGLALALVTAVVTAVVQNRQRSTERQQYQERLLAQSRAHGMALREERRDNATVLDAMAARAHQLREDADRLRVNGGQLRATVSTLHGDLAHLAAEVQHRDLVIASLRETVQAREAELAAMHGAAGDGDAEIHTMPRRDPGQQAASGAEPALVEADLWSDGTHPTVVDLQALESVLPHVEAERQAI